MLQRMSKEYLAKLPQLDAERMRERVRNIKPKAKAKSCGEEKSGEGDGEEAAEGVDPMAEMLYNLGIPIVVLATRSDSQTIAEAAEVQSPIIEMHLRQACIPYGAALIYACVQEKGSEKSSLNVDLLYKYLLHRLYAYKFEGQAVINSRDALFIPSGWDGEIKLDKAKLEKADFANSGFDGLLKSFESVFTPPTQTSAADHNMETFEALEAFLQRTQGTLQKLGGASAAAVRTSATPTTVPAQAPAADGPSNASKDNAQLTSFFQNLLTKGGTPIPQGGAAGATPPAAPPPAGEAAAAGPPGAVEDPPAVVEGKDETKEAS